jgi:hypothetical protein
MDVSRSWQHASPALGREASSTTLEQILTTLGGEHGAFSAAAAVRGSIGFVCRQFSADRSGRDLQSCALSESMSQVFEPRVRNFDTWFTRRTRGDRPVRRSLRARAHGKAV